MATGIGCLSSGAGRPSLFYPTVVYHSLSAGRPQRMNWNLIVKSLAPMTLAMIVLLIAALAPLFQGMGHPH